MKNIKKLCSYYFLFLCICFLINFVLFFGLFISKSVIFNLAFTPFDICLKYPRIWFNIKCLYVLSCFIAYTILFKSVIIKFIKSPKKEQFEEKVDKDKIRLKIGTNKNENSVFIEEEGLYQESQAQRIPQLSYNSECAGVSFNS